jgi:hypothetical protein
VVRIAGNGRSPEGIERVAQSADIGFVEARQEDI